MFRDKINSWRLSVVPTVYQNPGMSQHASARRSYHNSRCFFSGGVWTASFPSPQLSCLSWKQAYVFSGREAVCVTSPSDAVPSPRKHFACSRTSVGLAFSLLTKKYGASNTGIYRRTNMLLNIWIGDVMYFNVIHQPVIVLGSDLSGKRPTNFPGRPGKIGNLHLDACG